MKKKLRCLDLFCGAGGATKGLQRAGFHVTGVDINPQPRYCGDAFIQGDALKVSLKGYDLIWASPPCQAYSCMRHLPHAKSGAPKLIEPTRRRLRRSGIPFVIENVPGAPLRDAFILCGSMFGLKSERGYLRRHRHFEASFPVAGIPSCNHVGLAIGVYGHGSAGFPGQRFRTANVAEAKVLMEMPWSTLHSMSQAIPPAYSEFIGRQARAMAATA